MDQRLAVEAEPPPLRRFRRETRTIVDRIVNTIESPDPARASREHDRLDRMAHRAAIHTVGQLQLVRQIVDRKSVGSGQSVSVRVYCGGRRLIKKKHTKN